jgi:hypothetical protein
MTTKTASILIGAAIMALASLAAFGLTGSCAPPTPAQTEKAEADLCKARAAELVIFKAAGGKLDPPPGSVREAVEKAEDALCAARAREFDGGP